MITISDKSLIHNRIMVFPDYSNDKQFYYLPPPPALADDLLTGRKVFKLLKLAGGLTDPTGDGVQTSGVVLFDCDLHLTDEQVDDLKEAIRSKFGVIGEVSLSPLLYKDGEVTCYVLGEQTPDDDEDTELGKRSNIFVEKLAGAGKPSLYGDNRATFSGKMTREGITALEASFAAGGVVGISVVYTLKFDALQPAYKFKVTADWERIYNYFEERVGLDLIFIDLKSTKMVETLEEEQLITFEEVIYEEDAIGELSELRKELQTYILEKYFVPIMSRDDMHNRQIPGMILDTLADAFHDSMLMPEFGYSRVEMTQEERKSFSFDMTRVTAKERVIYPQAQLTALVTAADLPLYVQEVNSDADLFFRQLEVEALVGGCDFAAHKIAWVHPYINYGSAPVERGDKVISSQDERMRFTTWVQPDHGFEYTTGYEVAFLPPDDQDPDTVYGLTAPLISPEVRSKDRVLAINPLELFEQRSIEFFLMEGFPANDYPVVEVQLVYEDSSGFDCRKSYFLMANAAERRKSFNVRSMKGVTGHAQYRLIYHPAQGTAVYREWEPVEGSYVLVKDPTPARLTISVSVADAAQEVLWTDIHLRYVDPQSPDDYQEKHIDFTNETGDAPVLMREIWSIETSDPKQQMYEYQYTIAYRDGSQLSSPDWIESEARTLTVGSRSRMFRTIVLRPVGPSFEDEELRDIQVTMTQNGTNSAEPPRQTFLFEDETQTHQFTYQVLSPEQLGYTYEIRYRWRNGMVKRRAGESQTGRLRMDIPTEIA